MKKNKNKNQWQLWFAAGLIALSFVLYSIHYFLFRDFHHIIIYLVGDIAFVPIEVLLVTLIIHQLLEVQQKKIMLKKLNMVIGTFYGEVGTQLLKDLSDFCTNIEGIGKQLPISTAWKQSDFAAAEKAIRAYSFSMDAFVKSPQGIDDFLRSKKDFFLNLLGNQNLLEHDDFTDLMWAVVHLAEELQQRDNLEDLPQSDKDHLSTDMKRAYRLLIIEWLRYMAHLKIEYPYLFSLAARMNPFNPEASPVVKS